MLLALAPWPELVDLDDPAAEAEIGWVIDLVTAIRSVRAEMNIAPSTLISVALIAASSQTHVRALSWTDVIQRLARTTGHIGPMNAAPPGSVQLLVRGEVVALPLAGVIDLAAERARLEKEMAKVDADIARIDAKLGNADFVARAPEEVVEGEREKRDEAQARRAKIVEALERVKGA
jgi:valyl-tRNA synthetase